MTMALTIGPNGASVPAYSDILTYYQNTYYSLYGSDADLTPASQDGQHVATFAQAVNDANQMGLAVYSSYAPGSAQGAALSLAVKLSGIRRKSASQSTVPVTIGGTVNTTIVNGLVGDTLGLGTQWALPPSVTIPSGGSITVTATCTVAGATNAGIGDIAQILNPQLGWQTATNPTVATSGNPVETDPQLLARQQASVAAPSVTPVGSIKANLLRLAGVGRVQVYENDTDSINSLGIPPHCVSAVVEGGISSQIAQTIQNTKSIGCSTYGTSSLAVTDQNGLPKVINWYPLSIIPLTVVVHVNALLGFNANTEDYIKQAVSQFISEYGIGDNSYLSRLYSPAQLKGDEATVGTGLTQVQLDALASTYSINSILQSRSGPPAASDVAASYYEVFTSPIANITVLTP
jgi:uncharacterized phage protein gp47/JayE